MAGRNEMPVVDTTVMKFVVLSASGLLFIALIYRAVLSLCKQPNHNNSNKNTNTNIGHSNHQLLLTNFILALLIYSFGTVLVLAFPEFPFCRILVMLAHLASLQIWCLWNLSRYASLTQTDYRLYNTGSNNGQNRVGDEYKLQVFGVWCTSAISIALVCLVSVDVDETRVTNVVTFVTIVRLVAIIISLPLCVASYTKSRDLKQDLVRRAFIIGYRRRALDAYANLKPSASFALFFCLWTCTLWSSASASDFLIVRYYKRADILCGLEITFGMLYVLVNPLMVRQLRMVASNVLMRRNKIAAAVTTYHQKSIHYCNYHLQLSPSSHSPEICEINSNNNTLNSKTRTPSKPRFEPRNPTLLPLRTLDIRSLGKCAPNIQHQSATSPLELKDVSCRLTVESDFQTTVC